MAITQSGIMLPWGDKIALTDDELQAVLDAVEENDLGTDLDDARKKIKPYYEAMCDDYSKRHPELADG